MRNIVSWQKKKQRQFMDCRFSSIKDLKYETNYFHDYFRALPFHALKLLLDNLGITLTAKSVLIASCGTGIDVHYLRKYYNPQFTVSDISQEAVKLTMSLNPNVKAIVQDTERLSFGDESFDYAFIAASLHHLPRPLVGLYELIRVAKHGVIAIEPNDSWLTRLATRLKLATEIEEAGNYVYRFNVWDIERISRALFYHCHSVRLFAVHRVARNSGEFALLRALNSLANLTLPALGNYIVFIINKD